MLKIGDAYICVSEQGILGSSNGLSPIRLQAITWPSAELLSIRAIETNAFRNTLNKYI